jgi:hypothetical protein
MEGKAFQDFYPDDFSRCYGCGRLNPEGLRIRSFREGDEAVCRFTPGPHHLSVPGFVYGGLLERLRDEVVSVCTPGTMAGDGGES